VAKREVCPMCKGCGHIIVLNWPEHCPKCKRTGFVKPEPKKPADGVMVGEEPYDAPIEKAAVYHYPHGRRAARRSAGEAEYASWVPAGVMARCPLCNYQHGHAIGCANNPVDIALAAGVAAAPVGEWQRGCNDAKARGGTPPGGGDFSPYANGYRWGEQQRNAGVIASDGGQPK
jgi:hypothetical protein